VVSRAQILECLWGDITVSARTVDTHVGNLRRKLGRSHVVIEGVRGSAIGCGAARAAVENS
jgi:DNA-binding response OmpR family regulator